MPMVSIDMTDEWTQASALDAGEVIYETLMDIFDVPENDKFQIINRHPEGTMNVAPNFHGNKYSSKIILIQIFLNQGRTVELKKQFYRSLMTRLSERVGCRPDDVVINLVEVSKENWSFGNGLAQLAE